MSPVGSGTINKATDAPTSAPIVKPARRSMPSGILATQPSLLRPKPARKLVTTFPI